MLPELHTVVSVQPAWLQEIVHSYQSDQFASELLQKLAAAPNSDSKFSL